MSPLEEDQILTAWFSPAFPVGAFAFSHGLEAAVEAGWVKDAKGLEHWIDDCLTFGSGRNDALLLAASWRDEDVAALSSALAASKERWEETHALGQAFATTVRGAWGLDIADGQTYPVAVGEAAALAKLPLSKTLFHFLQAFVSNLISVGVRHIPLGQTEGQKCLKHLLAKIKLVAETCEHENLEQIGGAALRADLAAIAHEGLTTRIYKT